MSFIAVERGERRLFVQQVEDGKQMRVTLPSGEIQSHVWAPTEKAYACLMRGDPDWMVHIVPTYFGADVPLQTVALPRTARSARLIRWIYRSIYLQVVESDSRSPSFQRIDLTTGKFERLAGPWNEMSGARGFDLTPDGRRVVWTMQHHRSRDDLYVADVNGGSPTRVTAVDDDSRKRFPSWNAAGTGVIYLSNRGGQQDLWELDIKSSQSIQLSSSPEVERPESTAQNGSRSYQVTEEKTTLFIWKAGDAGGGVQVSYEGLNDLAPGASSGGRPQVVFQRNKPYALEGLPRRLRHLRCRPRRGTCDGADRSQEGRYRLRAAVVARRKVPGVFTASTEFRIAVAVDGDRRRDQAGFEPLVELDDAIQSTLPSRVG